jgi:hypothetical protein
MIGAAAGTREPTCVVQNRTGPAATAITYIGVHGESGVAADALPRWVNSALPHPDPIPAPEPDEQAEATNHEVLPASPTTQPKPADGAGIPETNRPTWSLKELQANGQLDA